MIKYLKKILETKKDLQIKDLKLEIVKLQLRIQDLSQNIKPKNIRPNIPSTRTIKKDGL